MESETVYTAMAACWAKEGAKMLQQFRDRLFEVFAKDEDAKDLEKRAPETPKGFQKTR